METDETEDDATMTIIASDEQSSIPTQSFSPDGLFNDDINDSKVRKRSNLSPIADISKQSKKVSTRSNSDVRPVFQLLSRPFLRTIRPNAPFLTRPICSNITAGIGLLSLYKYNLSKNPIRLTYTRYTLVESFRKSIPEACWK